MMKNKLYTLNLLLTAVLGIVLLAAIMVRTFAPAHFLPKLDIPAMVLISLIALVLDHYLAPDAKHCYAHVAVLSALTFGLLPFAACFVGLWDALKLGLVGGVVFTVMTWLYTSALDRLSSGPAKKAAPVVCAVGLWLAAQCFAGIVL